VAAFCSASALINSSQLEREDTGWLVGCGSRSLALSVSAAACERSDSLSLHYSFFLIKNLADWQSGGFVECSATFCWPFCSQLENAAAKSCFPALWTCGTG